MHSENKGFSQTNSLLKRTENLLKTVAKVNGHFIKVFYKTITYRKLSPLSSLLYGCRIQV